MIYNGAEFPPDCVRPDVRVVAAPFAEIAANELGDQRVGNMVMMGALLEVSGGPAEASINAALRRLVRNSKFVELDLRAIARGRELCRRSLEEV